MTRNKAKSTEHPHATLHFQELYDIYRNDMSLDHRKCSMMNTDLQLGVSVSQVNLCASFIEKIISRFMIYFNDLFKRNRFELIYQIEQRLHV